MITISIRDYTTISIHALRVEGDPASPQKSFRACDFYPRPPGGGRPVFILYLGGFYEYFYPRPPGGGRHKRNSVREQGHTISIHALRVEGDRC